MNPSKIHKTASFAVLGAVLAACGTKDDEPARPAPALSTVTSFDAAAFELAEGLTVHQGKAYVGLAPLGKILAVDPNGNVSTYASVPAGYDQGYTLGLAFDAAHNLYVAQTKNAPDASSPAPGILKIPPSGGSVEQLFASHPEMTFPNGIAVDEAGGLFVTDSASGTVFRVTPDGAVTKWSAAPELSGSPACPAPLPFPIGANGVSVTPERVFVTNTAKGSLVSIERSADGSAGAVTTVVEDCGYVGFDGLSLDEDGSFVIAQNGAPGRLLRISSAGEVRVLHEGAPADGPASVAFAEQWGAGPALLVTSSAFFSVGVPGKTPNPSLASYGPLTR